MLYGGGLLTPQITKTAESLLRTMTPMKWDKQWEGPEEPQPYMQAVITRKIALVQWYVGRQPMPGSTGGPDQRDTTRALDPCDTVGSGAGFVRLALSTPHQV